MTDHGCFDHTIRSGICRFHPPNRPDLIENFDREFLCRNQLDRTVLVPIGPDTRKFRRTKITRPAKDDGRKKHHQSTTHNSIPLSSFFKNTSAA
jgi:hypothetical protein